MTHIKRGNKQTKKTISLVYKHSDLYYWLVYFTKWNWKSYYRWIITTLIEIILNKFLPNNALKTFRIIIVSLSFVSFKLCNSYHRAHSFARIMQTKHCKLWTVTALSRYNCGGSSREWAVNSRDTRVWCATKGDEPQIIYNYCRCCFMLACLYTQVRLSEFTLFAIISSSVLC